ncbi:uncharacterized protein LOC119731907 [Patiria miniata]|uniref:Uncharacterized protein n=1 Tax=Patiria miniata TaxID=46514 RepID=A0A914AB54_PATMI|nr:uncharacterized protein LOC119731907 [Patiria miniata]
MLLIGGDTPEVFWVLEERRGRRKEPYAVRSLLGWTLLGPTATTEKQFSFKVNHVLLEDDLLLRTVEKFWEMDFGGKMADGEVADSVEDKRARTIMTETVTKVDGHYQVKVPDNDSDALRFLWWPNGDYSKEPTDHKMLVHLFGATSSPSCAGFCLRKTAEDNRENFDKETVTTVRENFYVDDCLVSTKTESEAIRLASQLIQLLAKGGFRLTKWALERTLGVRWDVEADQFGFEAAVKCKPATRRGILSTVSSLYDPLGFLAPFILPVKILLQDLCRQGRGWDEKVEECEMMRWKRWLDDLPRLTCVLLMCMERSTAHLSWRGARLCPVKQVTIPRLELSAAVLAVRLNQLIQREIRLPITETVYWTDSTSVLQYIQNESRRFHTFVANRVSRIQSGHDPSQWRYVDTASNPADDGSRGLTADTMIKNQRWLNGPDFLLKEEQHWPLPPVVIKGPYPDVLPDTLQSDPEVKKVVQSYSIVEKDCVQELDTHPGVK